MSLDIAISIVMTLVIAATPILLAGLGELVAEKSGVLNLGVEGMMLVGAVAGFIAASASGFTPLGYAVARARGLGASLLFAVLALTLGANQVATGLALTIFGTGLSSLAGAGFVGTTITTASRALFPRRSRAIRCCASSSAMTSIVYLSVALTLAAAWFLNRTRAGLILRVRRGIGRLRPCDRLSGDRDPLSRRRLRRRLGGVAGAYYSLAVTPMWADRITAGRGWIALALVVFSVLAALAASPRRLHLRGGDDARALQQGGGLRASAARDACDAPLSCYGSGARGHRHAPLPGAARCAALPR